MFHCFYPSSDYVNSSIHNLGSLIPLLFSGSKLFSLFKVRQKVVLHNVYTLFFTDFQMMTHNTELGL